MTERKLSILRSLLARVQERTSGSRPRPAAPSAEPTRPEPSAQLNALAVLEEEVTAEAVPPSAPRVREAALDALSEDSRATQKHTVVPEVEQPVRADAEEAEEPEEEMDIAITVSDSDNPPDGGADAVDIPQASSVSQFSDMPPSGENGVDGGLELENETPLPGIAGEAPPAPARDELSWPPAAPPPPVQAPVSFEAPIASSFEPPVPAAAFEPPPAFEPPAPEALAAAPALEASPSGPAFEPAFSPAVPPAAVDAPPPAYEAPPPISLREVAPPFELPPPEPALTDVTPQVHRAPVLRGHVGIFIEQSRTFSPQSFGELLDASIGLGRDA